jgi:ATP-dependent helicase/nuclease subunit A
MNFTPEQSDAIYTHDRNLIVTAGAGSGKTRVLVERFIALLDANPDWALPDVVAITFTEKAAREMRDRVRRAIEERIAAAAAGDDPAALERWMNHQVALNMARIGTIHSLCAHILRANPAAAELDPSFAVLDETEAGILHEDAVEQTLADLGHGEHPAAQLLAAYDVRDVRAVLAAYSTPSDADQVRAALDSSPDALLDRWRADWADAMQRVMAEVRADETLRAALAWEPAGVGWPADDKLMDNWRLIRRQTPALFGDDPDAFADAVTALAAGINRRGGKQDSWGGADGVRECKDVLGVFQDWAKGFTMLPRPDDDADGADRAAAEWLLLWRDAILLAAETYTRLKADRAVLDFDDLETRTRALLAAHPEVTARCRAAFRQVLVDEFQDTNQAQRAIIYALTGAGAPDPPGRDDGQDGRLFVVGDPKQSIYAFRGADVSVFGAVRDDLRAAGGEELPLSTSFRAHEKLVTAFNAIFDHILAARADDPFAVALEYPMRAFRPAQPAQVALHDVPISLLLLDRPDKDLHPDWQRADELRRWEAWELAQHIHDLVAGEQLVWDGDLRHDDPRVRHIPEHAHPAGQGAYRPVCYGDMAILFQAMTRAPLYEEVFKAAELPYVTVAGQGYFDRQEVWDLLHLLRALHNPADDLALAVVLRSPLFGLSDEALYALRLLRDDTGARMPLWAALFAGEVPLFPAEDAAARDFARVVLDELRDMAGRATIAELLARALHLTGYLATLTGLPDGARRRGNVEKLLALARASGRVSLGAFNVYAQDLTAREVREGEAVVAMENTVTLMSVHASKGLEFPVVILADTAWRRGLRRGVFTVDREAGAACKLPVDDPDGDDPQPFAWEWSGELAARRDLAERRRLLYVAATRAQDYLVVSGSRAHASDGTWLRQWLTALGLDDDDLAPGPDPVRWEYPGGACWCLVPPEPPQDLAPGTGRARTGWDDPAVQGAQLAAGVEPALLPLLAPVPVPIDAPARALTATQIAKLGEAAAYEPPARGRAAFRHSVLHDAPDAVRPLTDQPSGGGRRVVGEMVHRALQAWLLARSPSLDVLKARLETYAWEQHLTDPAQVRDAIRQAEGLLARFMASDLCDRLARAEHIYSELPFVYLTSTGRAIHGVIDVLFWEGEQWHVLDFKTSPVASDRVPGHARRYYLQLGVYASAVDAFTGAVPQAYLYYIHAGRLVPVTPGDWRPALDRLEADLRAALDVRR